MIWRTNYPDPFVIYRTHFFRLVLEYDYFLGGPIGTDRINLNGWNEAGDIDFSATEDFDNKKFTIQIQGRFQYLTQDPLMIEFLDFGLFDTIPIILQNEYFWSKNPIRIYLRALPPPNTPIVLEAETFCDSGQWTKLASIFVHNIRDKALNLHYVDVQEYLDAHLEADAFREFESFRQNQRGKHKYGITRFRINHWSSQISDLNSEFEDLFFFPYNTFTAVLGQEEKETAFLGNGRGIFGFQASRRPPTPIFSQNIGNKDGVLLPYSYFSLQGFEIDGSTFEAFDAGQTTTIKSNFYQGNITEVQHVGNYIYMLTTNASDQENILYYSHKASVFWQVKGRWKGYNVSTFLVDTSDPDSPFIYIFWTDPKTQNLMISNLGDLNNLYEPTGFTQWVVTNRMPRQLIWKCACFGETSSVIHAIVSDQDNSLKLANINLNSITNRFLVCLPTGFNHSGKCLIFLDAYNRIRVICTTDAYNQGATLRLDIDGMVLDSSGFGDPYNTNAFGNADSSRIDLIHKSESGEFLVAGKVLGGISFFASVHPSFDGFGSVYYSVSFGPIANWCIIQDMYAQTHIGEKLIVFNFNTGTEELYSIGEDLGDSVPVFVFNRNDNLESNHLVAKNLTNQDFKFFSRNIYGIIPVAPLFLFYANFFNLAENSSWWIEINSLRYSFDGSFLRNNKYLFFRNQAGSYELIFLSGEADVNISSKTKLTSRYIEQGSSYEGGEEFIGWITDADNTMTVSTGYISKAHYIHFLKELSLCKEAYLWTIENGYKPVNVNISRPMAITDKPANYELTLTLNPAWKLL